MQVVEGIGYGREVTDNVRGFVTVRLASLRLGTTGRFLHAPHPLHVDRLLARNVVLEIEDVGDDHDKAFLIGAVLIRLIEHLRVRDRRRPHGGGLRHLTVIEEAHRLLRRPDHPGPAAHAVELFAALLAEIRAYGEGLIVAEQIPAKLIPDVVKNTAVKIMHRLPARDDRDAVGATMNLSDEQSRYLVTLPPGTGVVFTDGMDHPLLARVPDSTRTEHPAAAAPAASPARLIATPAAGCGPACHAQPCTLRETTTAGRLLTDHPTLVVWAELAMLAHLAGMPTPHPGAALATALRTLDPQTLECAVGQAVNIAVVSRGQPLADSHSPAHLAAHTAEELRTQLVDTHLVDAIAGVPACPGDRRRWLAPCFRWNLVRLALQDLNRRDPAAGRHPDSPAWETVYGQPIPGATCREQLGTVRRWCIDLIRDPAAVDGILYGTHTPSALETAVGDRRIAPTWRQSLSRATDQLVVYRGWPVAFLAPDGVPAEARLVNLAE